MYTSGNASLRDAGIFPRLASAIDRSVARARATFKQADLVRAVKAAHAAGLAVTATQITPDGTIRLIHTESAPLGTSEFDRLEAEL